MRRYFPIALTVLLPAVLFLPYLGGVHLFDWDEINFAECAREMMVSGDYLRPQIDFMPFWEKPPFFIWLQVLCMKLFGVGEYSARLPDALTGIAAMVSIYYVGVRTAGKRVATWWVVLTLASWLPHFYFRSGIIDPVFNLFIFGAFFQVSVMRTEAHKWRHAAIAGLLLGMAALTKGPVAILVAGLSAATYFIIHRGTNKYSIKHFGVVALCSAAPFLVWTLVTIAAHGWEYGRWFMNEFISYQVRLLQTEDSGHGGPFIYHFVVLLAGCFPASVFLFQYIGKKTQEPKHDADFRQWMWILFWVVLILFSIVKTKIVHYSSLCYYPLTYLAAVKVARIVEGRERIKAGVKVLFLTLGSIFGLVVAALPLVAMHKAALVPYIADPFAVGNLQASTHWSYADSIAGIICLAGIWGGAAIMRRNITKGFVVLCVCQVVAIQATTYLFVGRVEAHSQRAAISYFEQFRGKDVYVQPLGYKSYANLFYTEKQPWTNEAYKTYRRDADGRETPEANVEWLLHGQTDKPAYFICKIMDSSKYANMPDLQVTGSENGFVFLKRR